MSIRKSAILICLFISTSLLANYGPTDLFAALPTPEPLSAV